LNFNGRELKIFDIHGHLQGTIPKLFRIVNRKIPPDVTLEDFRSAGLYGGIVSTLGDPNTFKLLKTNTYTYVLKETKKIKSEVEKIGAHVALNVPQLITYTKHEGDLAFVIGIEGADFIKDDLSRLSKVYDLGVRVITLIHYTNNSIGTRCMDLSRKEEKSGGLTTFGEKIVKKMNALGIIVDLAHANERTAFEVVETSKKPLMCSHTGPRELQDFPRFISDDLIKFIAREDGIIGMWGGLYRGRGAHDLKMFSEFVEYVVDLVGVEHVSIGTEFNGVPGNMGYTNIHDYKHIIGALLEKGFSVEDVEKICFENFLRLFKEVNL